MNHTPKDLLSLLIDLYAEQEGVTITYDYSPREDEHHEKD